MKSFPTLCWDHQPCTPCDRIPLNMIASLKLLPIRWRYKRNCYAVSPPTGISSCPGQEEKVVRLSFQFGLGKTYIISPKYFNLPWDVVLEMQSLKSFLSLTLGSWWSLYVAQTRRVFPILKYFQSIYCINSIPQPFPLIADLGILTLGTGGEYKYSFFSIKHTKQHVGDTSHGYISDH